MNIDSAINLTCQGSAACDCRVTRGELESLFKQGLINSLNSCPSCEHKFGNHPSGNFK